MTAQLVVRSLQHEISPRSDTCAEFLAQHFMNLRRGEVSHCSVLNNLQNASLSFHPMIDVETSDASINEVNAPYPRSPGVPTTMARSNPWLIVSQAVSGNRAQA